MLEVRILSKKLYKALISKSKELIKVKLNWNLSLKNANLSANKRPFNDSILQINRNTINKMIFFFFEGE